MLSFVRIPPAYIMRTDFGLKVEDCLGLFICKRCGLTYKDSQHLDHHLQNECGTLSLFICPCTKTFKKKESYEKHLRENRMCSFLLKLKDKSKNAKQAK